MDASSTAAPLRVSEYDALRRTIRERGTLRMSVVLTGLIGWAALALAVAAGPFDRAAVLVPLVVLASTFEINLFVHTGVERIGRYLQVYFESEAAADALPQWGWEHAVMSYGKAAPGGSSPLFVTLFVIAGLTDFVCCLPPAGRHAGWIGISVLAHLAFFWRIARARALAAAQRVRDLEVFTAIKSSPQSK